MKKIILLAVGFLLLTVGSFAQNTNTLYFMEEISTRNQMNPAFLPQCKSYFDLILLPNIYLGAGENAFTINDLVKSSNGKTSTVLAKQSTIDNFLKSMPSAPYLKTDFRLNILNFGARLTRGHYLIFDFNLRNEENIFIPRDVFRFALTGMTDMDGVNKYDLSSFSVNSTTYATAGIGYSGRLSKKVTFGFNAKFLLGLMNATTSISQFDLSASRQEWVVNSGIRADVNSPFPMGLKKNADNTFSADFNMDLDSLRPAGYGASFDIGLTYEPVENLVISAAVVDLGFINWGKGYSYVGTINGTYKFDGLGEIGIDNVSSFDTGVLDSLYKQMRNDIQVDKSKEGDKWMMINGKFNFGVEYGILKNKISFGVVNQLAFTRSNIYDEVTLAVNFRPANWFKASLSYSFLNGNWGTLGLGLNLNLGAFDLYLVSDYIPITYTQIQSEKYAELNNLTVPDRVQYVNLQFGTIFNIGRFARDLDGDGVRNRKDKCPDTDVNFLKKKCPKWKTKDLVDDEGCNRDEDHDGVHDCIDQCPGTPEGVAVDSVGCSLDADNDGIADTYDQCPGTPEGVQVDNKGCPLDEDADGVPDYVDQCPSTPQGVQVDDKGCPVDSDNDGVVDYLDKCPNTPEGVVVDEDGCPVDEDSDGVPDYIDSCMHTPRGVAVDSKGCPLDTDNDSIPDYQDRCPDRPGPATNYGCPEPTELKNLLEQARYEIQFVNGQSTIMASSYPILDQIVALLTLDTKYSLEIMVHTDNSGKSVVNQRLSEDRASAVRLYFIDHGISSTRLTSEGFGDTQPVVSNKNKKEKTKNNRVEFNLVFDK